MLKGSHSGMIFGVESRYNPLARPTQIQSSYLEGIDFISSLMDIVEILVGSENKLFIAVCPGTRERPRCVVEHIGNGIARGGIPAIRTAKEAEPVRLEEGLHQGFGLSAMRDIRRYALDA